MKTANKNMHTGARAAVITSLLAVVLVMTVCRIARAEGAAKDGTAEQGAIKLSAEQAERFGVKTAVAESGRLVESLQLPGEVRLNSDRVAHVTARISGVVTEVPKKLGDLVHTGEVLTVIESRDLAIAKAAYLAAQKKLTLAKTSFSREKTLWEKKISAEQDYLEAQQALAETEIGLTSAEQQLRALGLKKEDLARVGGHSEDSYTRYEITAPIDGTIIEKKVVLGESLAADAAAFIVADLANVWIDFSVPAKDLAQVSIGQKLTIANDDKPGAEGIIGYMGPTVDQESRAALARVVMPNTDGKWKPGMFVTGSAEKSSVDVPVLIDRNAMQSVNGAPHVFVRTSDGFKATPITTGRSNDTRVEILSGLKAGDTYASDGTFVLKSEMEKGKGGEE